MSIPHPQITSRLKRSGLWLASWPPRENPIRCSPQGICNASAEPQRWASQREQGTAHTLAGCLGNRAGTGNYADWPKGLKWLLKQIWEKQHMAKFTTLFSLFLIHMQPSPNCCSGILWLLCIFTAGHATLFAVVFTPQTPGSLNRKKPPSARGFTECSVMWKEITTERQTDRHKDRWERDMLVCE